MISIKTLVFNPFEENTYIIYDESGDCAIIDPGCFGPEEENQLVEEIKNLNVNPVLLLNTHCHIGYRHATAQHLIREQDIIRFGESELQVLFVPGHTEGHLAFVNTYDKVCLAGDVLFDGSIGRTDLPGGDFNTLINSIHDKLFVLQDDMVVYPGHGATTTIGKEKKSNPFCAIK